MRRVQDGLQTKVLHGQQATYRITNVRAGHCSEKCSGLRAFPPGAFLQDVAQVSSTQAFKALTNLSRKYHAAITTSMARPVKLPVIEEAVSSGKERDMNRISGIVLITLALGVLDQTGAAQKLGRGALQNDAPTLPNNWMILSALGVAGVGVAAQLGSQDVDNGPRNRHTFTVDVAADCRTFVTGPNRADVSYGSGKIFPAGTLSSGTANNDPTKPVNGVAAIGDWTTRGQNAFPFPPEVAESYSLTPTFFATQYYILDGARTALTVEGYAFFEGATPTKALFSVTGGIGRFRGVAGDLEGTALGTNATGCPNFRTTFKLVRGSLRGASNY
jgi:hypothetical protein